MSTYKEASDSTGQDTAGQDTAGQDKTVQDTAVQDAAVESTSVQEAAVESTSVQNAAVESTSVQERAASDSGNQNIADQDFDAKDPAIQDRSGQDGDDQGSHDDDDEWMLILGHERLKKRVLQTGDKNEARPRPRDIVSVKICGRMADNIVVDESDSLTFTIGDGDVVQALDLGVALMELGEVAEIYTEAQYAYGHAGRKGDIPPDSAITYTVELLSRQNPPDFSSMPFADRIHLGDKKRERGNYHYSRGDFSAAIHSYSRAQDILSLEGSAKETDESINQLTDLRIKCFSNTAAAQLKVEAWDSCISSCDQVLRVQSNNVKALFRRGKALASKGELDEAISCLRNALNIEPDSKIVHQEMSKLVRKKNTLLDSEKTMYRRMIGNDKSLPDENVKTQSKWKMFTVGAVIAGILSVGISVYKSYHW